MLKTILARIKQKHRTMGYPDEPAVLPELFQGYPLLQPEKCPADCQLCAAACPYGAIATENGLALDMGKCIFCRECVLACPQGAISFSTDNVFSDGTDLQMASMQANSNGGYADAITFSIAA